MMIILKLLIQQGLVVVDVFGKVLLVGMLACLCA